MLKSLLRKDLNLRKFKTSAFLVKHMTPLTLFLLTWMSIDCRKFARKLYFAKKTTSWGKVFCFLYTQAFYKKLFTFVLVKFQIRTLCFWHGLMMLKINFQNSFFFFLLAVWNLMDNRIQQADKVCEWYFCFSNFTLFQQKNSISVFFCWEARKTYLAYVG